MARATQVETVFPDLGALFRHRMPEFDDREFAFLLDEQTTKEFGLTHLPNPAVSCHPRYALAAFDGSLALGWTLKSNGKDGHLRVERHQMGIGFPLDHPLEKRIKRAMRMLRAAQAARLGKPAQKRWHSTKWLTYLRVLDAREAGASWAEIATILPQTAGTPQTASDVWDQARALCFKF